MKQVIVLLSTIMLGLGIAGVVGGMGSTVNDISDTVNSKITASAINSILPVQNR